MHIPAKASFLWSHSLQQVMQLCCLSPINIGQKIKEVEHAYYLRAFIGASFQLSPILSIMAFRTYREDILHTLPPSEHPSWATKKKGKKHTRKKKKWQTKRQKLQRLPSTITPYFLSKRIKAQLLHKEHHFNWNGCCITHRVTMLRFTCNLVRLNNCIPIDSRFWRGSSKGWVLRWELHTVRWNACIPLFDMWMTKRADWAWNSHPGKRAQAHTATILESTNQTKKW